jgi:acetyl esterase/lipase
MSARELKELIALLTSRPVPENPTPELLRERFERLGQLLPAPAEAIVERLDAGNVPAERVAAPGADKGDILFLHGGGYVIGSPATHRTLAYNFSKASGCRTLLLDYRLAPEHPFPAAVDDAVAGYRFLLDGGARPGRIAIAGDSAGGGLVVAALVAIRDKGLPLPAAAVSISPWIDLEATGASIASKAKEDPIVEKGRLMQMAGLYLAGADAKSPLAAPLHADLKGLPPLFIQVGSAEILLDDALRLAARARAAGVAVEFEEAADMIHVWHLFAPMLSEGREAIGRAGAFIRRHLA